jgi:lipoprotein NlpI
MTTHLPEEGTNEHMKTRWIILGWILAGSLVQAQPATDADGCRDTKNNPDLAIKHCTAAIESRKATSEMIAAWYVQRGVYWSDKRDYDKAIADHTTALKIDAKARNANYYRGTAWSNKGEFERALADFDAAIKIRTDDPVLFHARAIELTVKGDYARALADFDKALQLDAKAEGVHFARGRALFYQSEFARAANDLETAFKARPNTYTALWLFLARKRGGSNDADDLLERETRRLRAGWPSPVIALYMGRTDVNSVMVGATAADAVRRRELRCEADFYVAHAHLIKGERPAAQQLLQGVQRECPKNLLEYEGAVAELRRLK